MSNSGTIADQEYSACQTHIGDPGLLPLVESLKAYFAFFNIKPKPFFGLHGATGTHPDRLYFYIVSVIKVAGLDGCHNNIRKEWHGLKNKIK